MSKTIIAVSHFGLGGRESLETAVKSEYHANDPLALMFTFCVYLPLSYIFLVISN